MLPAYIIEEIRKREERRRREESERPVIRVPLDDDLPPTPSTEGDADKEDGGRGVVIIDMANGNAGYVTL